MNIEINQLPEALTSHVSNRWSDFLRACERDQVALTDATHLKELPRVWAASDFIANACVANPALLQDLILSNDLARDYETGVYADRLSRLLEPIDDDNTLMRQLRLFRKREMVRIAWRDIAQTAALNTTLAELTGLAEACVQTASRWLQNQMRGEFGTPVDSDGNELDLVVLGMGKLGAWELNYSSDIDLIYTFREEGQTRDGQRTLTNGEFFIRLGQRLSRVLNDNTPDGYVFRVDTRLRPFGGAGQLALSFDAMESYYEQHGREWERYALIKARVVAGNEAHGKELMARLKPFVYRRYLDYGAFESLREMKQLIMTEVKRKGMDANVKLGGGGIREIEFIGQAFQLIRGGQEKRLQDRRIQTILPELGRLNLVPSFVVRHLLDAYRFLRLTENRLQELGDQQTHVLPDGDFARLRIAFGMGFASWAEFIRALDEHRGLVQEHFEQVFAAPQAEESQAQDKHTAMLTSMWLGRLVEADAIAVLENLGFADAAEVYRVTVQLRESSALRSLTPRAHASGSVDAAGD